MRLFLRRYPDGLSTALQERLLNETAIETRHFGIDFDDESKRESNTSMAVRAGQRALDAAAWRPADVDLLVVTTIVPDQLMPPTSTLVQESLGIERCVEVEISANCTAPYKGLLFAASQLRLGTVRRALVCAVQYASFLFQPPWANPQSMGEDQGLVRWIVSDGAGALALECGEPDTELRVWLESSGCGERSGMFLPLGSAHPDLLGNFRDGGQHVTQDGRYVLRVGVPRALRALSRMLDCLDVAPGKIDHFLPAVSSAQLEQGLRRLMAQHCGVPSDCWRVNFRRVGYLGGVGLTVLLDEMARAQQLRPGDLVCAFAEESSKWMAAGLALRWNP